MLAPVLVALAIGAVVALALLGLRSRSVFEIRVGDEVTVRGAVPGHAASDVARFVADLDLPRGARIRAEPDGERFRLVFSAHVPRDEHQRLRNFLYTTR